MPEKPLAERMRPKTLADFQGQNHLIGGDGILNRIIIQNHPLPSLLFWGPPGVGKTTLAYLLAESSGSPFFKLSAIQSGVKEIRDIIESSKYQGGLLKKPVLFIDEIHRFSKSQQDSLLSAVEEGILTLMGATTENPSFEINAALLSRCQVYILNPLENNDLIELLNKAIHDDPYLKKRDIILAETDNLLAYSGGDARKLLNTLELVISTIPENEKVCITNDMVNLSLQRIFPKYDKSGDEHHNLVSAFIKSIRGSDPNAAVYYLARLIESGEDPGFIARRLLILSSEDIGNANPTALIMANSCFQAVKVLGYPECSIILSQTAIYLASSPKSNASYSAIKKAQEMVRNMGVSEIPFHLRNPSTQFMRELGYGKNYLYAHEFPENFIEQEFLPDKLSGTVFYEPGKNTREEEIRKRLKNLWKKKYGY